MELIVYGAWGLVSILLLVGIVYQEYLEHIGKGSFERSDIG